jgi:hypothetical protein
MEGWREAVEKAVSFDFQDRVTGLSLGRLFTGTAANIFCNYIINNDLRTRLPPLTNKIWLSRTPAKIVFFFEEFRTAFPQVTLMACEILPC